MIEEIKSKGYYLIAEIGVNYYDIAIEKKISNMDAAKLMILEASKAGVDAVKFQTYKSGTLAAKKSPSYWDQNEEPTKSQYELFRKFDSFGKKEYMELAEYSKQCKIDFLSTPFDFESADYLYEMMDVYKISSSDLNNLPFIEYISAKNKPILLSIGASTEDEIELAVRTIRKNNTKELTLLHCVLEYPTPYEHANLLKIRTLSEKYFDCIIGYSDHTKPDEYSDVIKVANVLGAQVIEKHFTLNKKLQGNDHYHAMDPNDVKNIIEGLKFVQKILGKGDLHFLDTEIAARKNARRSIVSNREIKKDEIISGDMVTFKRPGTGISPCNLSEVIGKRAKETIEEDTIITAELLR